MKKLLAVLALTAVAAFAATRGDVVRILDRALAGEREAAARYDAYAAKADEEGYHAVAALFRAQAAAERVHEQRFADAMRARSIPVPPNGEQNPTVWSTADNLRASIKAENEERDGIYREAIDTARLAGDDAVALVFDQARDTETEHGNLCTDALRKLSNMKDAKSYFVCDKCGYTTDFDLPMCPLCRNGKHPHEVN